MIDTSAANQTHRMIAAADQRLASAASGSSLAAAAVAAAAAHAAHAAHSASNAAAAAAAGGSNTNDHGTTMSAAQKNPFAIQELLGLTSHGDQIKASSNGGTGSTNNPSNPSSVNSVSGMGASFPPISCYNSSFFNSSAVDQYSQHQRMYFNSAGLFGNLHHQSQSFATSSAAASHLLDSTLRSDHSLSSKQKRFSFSLFNAA